MVNRYSLVVLGAMLCLVMLPVVQAIVVERIEVTDCSFIDDAPAGCGDQRIFACTVNTTFQGDPDPTIQVVRVFFENGAFVDLELESGTTRNGLWQAVVTPELHASTANSINPRIMVTRISAYDSVGNVGPNGCDFTVTGPNQNYEAAECIGSTGFAVYVQSYCTCYYTNEVSCGENNVQTTARIPSSGCSDTTPVIVEGVCDYCNPGWLPVYGACTRDLSWNATDKMQGVSIKRYYAQNQDCVALAQGGVGEAADAIPPADDGALMYCEFDTWATQGKRVDGSSRAERVAGMPIRDNLRNVSVAVTSGTDVAGRILKPLVADVNMDGVQDVVVITGNGFTAKRSDILEGVMSSVTLGVWTGQPSLWGYAIDPSDVFAPSVRNGSAGLGIAGVVLNTTDYKYYFVSARFSAGGSLQEVVKFAIEDVPGITSSTSGSTGTVCSTTYCWFITENMQPVLVDVEGMHDLYTPASAAIAYTISGAGSPPSGLLDDAIQPVLVNLNNAPTSQVVVWVGYRVLDKTSYFACTTTGVCAKSDLLPGEPPSLDLARTSPIIVGQKVAYSSTAVNVSLYVSNVENVSGTDVAMVYGVKLVATGVNSAGVASGLSFAGHVLDFVDGIGGGELDCISQPALARCSLQGAEGIALVSSWKPSITSSVTLDPWTMPQVTESGGTLVRNPLSGINAGSPLSAGDVLCGATTCYIVSGSTTAGFATTGSGYNIGDYSIYKNVDDGSFSQITTFGLIDAVSVSSTSACYARLAAGDRIWGLGVYGDDLIVLLRNWQDQGGNSDCNAIQKNLVLMRYSSSTNSWSTVIDFGNVSNNNYRDLHTTYEGNTLLQYLRCGEHNTPYCMWPIKQNGEMGFIVVNMDAKTVVKRVNLKGTYFGGNLNATTIKDFWYESDGDAIVATGSGSSSQVVVEYKAGAPDAAVVLDSSSSKYFTGLAEDEYGRVFWTALPLSGTTLSYNQTTEQSEIQEGLDYIVDMLGGKIKYPSSLIYYNCGWWGCNGPHQAANNTYTDRYVSVSRYPGSIGPAPEIVSDATWRFSNYNTFTFGHQANAISGRYVKPYAGFDTAGEYYAFINVLGSTSLSGHYMGSPVMSAVLGVYADGGAVKAYFPHGVEVAMYNSTVAYTPQASVCDDVEGGGTHARFGVGGVSWPGSESVDTECFPSIIGDYGSWNSGPDLQSYPIGTSPRIVRALDTSTGYFVIDYIQSAVSSSLGVEGYNQLTCYAFASLGGSSMGETATSILGSTYCPGQIAAGDMDGDGVDEILTPEGLFSTSGGMRYKFDTGLKVPLSAMELVDVNGDSYTDILEATSSSLRMQMSVPKNVGYRQQGIVAANDLYCTLAYERNLACEAQGKTKEECQVVTLNFAPQVLAMKNPSTMYWTAKVYRNYAADAGDVLADAIAQSTGMSTTTFSRLLDMWFRIMGLDFLAGVAPIVNLAAGSTILESPVAAFSGTSGYGSYVVTSSGDYLVVLDVFDAALGQSKKGLWCEVQNVTISASSAVIQDETGICSLGNSGVDGDFNYDGKLASEYGWAVSVTGSGSHRVSEGALRMEPADETSNVKLSHSMDCSDKQVTAEIKLRAGDVDDGNMQFSIYGTSGDRLLPVSLFYARVIDGELTVMAYGRDIAPVILYQQDVDTTEWITVYVSVDRATGQTVTRIGDQTATHDILNTATGPFTGVFLGEMGLARFAVDYVRISTSGIVFEDEELVAPDADAKAYLDNCTPFAELMGGEYSLSNGTVRAPNVIEYCSLVPGNKNGKCLDINLLVNAVHYNSRCYDEAYQYCVKVQYPQDAGVKQTGVDGATVCATALTMGTAVDNIVGPSLKYIWSTMTRGSNVVYFLLILVAVFLIAVVRVKR